MPEKYRAAFRAPVSVLAVFAAALLLLSGCQQFGAYKGYSAAPIDVSQKDTTYDRLDNAIKVRTPGIDSCFAEKYRTGGVDADLCYGLRNQVISYLMAESISLCTRHVSEIYGNEAGFNIATGSIAAFTSGVASVSVGTGAKTLSAISSFASAERSLVNESVYRNLLTTAIATKIEQSRATLGKALLGRKSQPYGDYRIEDAIYDVIDYHHACSFYKGMELALSEGTNTNPASKLASLETKAQALAQQIDTRAVALKMDDASRKALLDAKGAAATGDPILKALVDQFQAVQHEIQTVNQAPAPAANKAASPAGNAGTANLDAGGGAAVNPLAALSSSDTRLKTGAKAVSEAVKTQAAQGSKTLNPAYVKAVDAAATAFAAGYHGELLGAGKLGDPGGGAIAAKMKAYSDAQSKYVIGTSTLNLQALNDQKKELGLRTDVQTAALEVNDLQRKVNACDKAATDRLKNFSDLQLSVVKDKNNDDLGKLTAAQGDPLAWDSTSTAACLK